MTLQSDVDSLRMLPLFSEVKREYLQFIAFVSEKKTFPSGKKIILNGEKADSAWIILNGEIDIIRNETQQTSLSVRKKPIFLGEVSLIGETEHRFSAMAKTQTDAIEVKRDTILRLIGEFPEFGMQIYKNIYGRFQAMMADLERLGELLRH